MIRQAPLTGHGGAPADFRDAWERTYDGSSREAIAHAHNLWLQFGVAYGAFGLLAVVAVTLLLLRAGSVRGAVPRAAVLGVLASNMVDTTLFYPWMLLPVISVLVAPDDRSRGERPIPSTMPARLASKGQDGSTIEREPRGR